MPSTARSVSRRARPEKGLSLPPGKAAGRKPAVLLGALLVLITVGVFWPVVTHEFLNYDDDQYVTGNDAIRDGWTWAGVKWAFTTGYAANWHPLTWLSHMSDVSLFGMNPAGHHAANLVLHAVNSLLLFLVFRRMTGDAIPSAWVAAVFAIHPAHVESVAWAAERKDVLCTTFWLLALLAYVRWVRRPKPGRYLAFSLLFAAGLLAKPMIVTFPLTLLLVDFWPLGRLSPRDGEASGPRGRLARLLALAREKAPLFLLAIASSVVTVIAQRSGGAVRTLDSFPAAARLENALVAYVRYLRMFVWPTRLAVFYPHPGTSIPVREAGAALLLLVAITAAAVALRRRAPFLLFGWLWFVVTLLPVIGLVQVGFQALADRYTYVPYIGLSAAVAWSGAWIARRWPRPARLVSAGAIAAVVALAVAAAIQVRYWKTSETLYLHAIAVTRGNFIARNNLGNYYNDAGRPAEAMPYLYEAIRIRPTYAEAYTNLGHSLFLLGRFEEAAQHFSESLRFNPEDGVTRRDLAWVRFLQGDIGDSVALYRRALTRSPGTGDARKRLGLGLLMQDDFAGAIAELRQAVALDPRDLEARELLEGASAIAETPSDASAGRMRTELAILHRQTASRLQARGKRAEAEAELRRALAYSPGSAEAHGQLGALLAGEGRMDEAAAEFLSALAIDPRSAVAHNDMGYVHFLRGSSADAIREYREALRLQPDLDLARKNLETALEQEKRRLRAASRH